MKITRMIGIAMVGAFASMALVGPSSASAKPVQLCKVKNNNCSAANTYGVGTKFKMSLDSGTRLVFTGSLPIECTGSTIEGEITELGGQQAIGTAISPIMSGCLMFGFLYCAYSTIQLPYTVHFDQDSGTLGDGRVWIGPQFGGQPGFEAQCPGISTCAFKVDEDQPGHEGSAWQRFLLSGGSPAKASLSNGSMKLAAGSVTECGASLAADAGYTVTEPTPLYVVHQE